MENQQKPSFSQIVIIILVLLLIIVGSVALYYRQKALVGGSSTASNEEQLQKDVNALLEKIGKLIVLPVDEKPVIATVTDPSKLKSQAFFANTQVGDKVIIYPQAKKAILYNPSLNKIVEVAPLNIGQPAETNAASDTSTTP